MPLTLHYCTTPKDMRRFVDLQYQIGKNWPQWVRAPRIQARKTLNAKKHPFFNHGNAVFVIALRDGCAVGRIAAIDDLGHAARYDDNALHFGFFDCEDDQEAAQALFGWLADQARAKGRSVVRGPFSYSVHDEIGLQIDAFDQQNFLLIPGNPHYYPDLFEAAGFKKCADLYCYGLPMENMPRRVIELGAKIQARFGLTVRSPTKASVRADIHRLQAVYNGAWKENWPWRPANDDEFAYIVESLLEVADLRYVQIAEDADGRMVGFSIAIPNMNDVFAKMPSGRLLPTGLAKILWYSRKDAVKTMRVIAMGVVEDWRNRGVDVIFHANQHAIGTRAGVTYVELSQVLEGNEMMKRTAAMCGADVRMTHRIYEHEI